MMIVVVIVVVVVIVTDTITEVGGTITIVEVAQTIHHKCGYPTLFFIGKNVFVSIALYKTSPLPILSPRNLLAAFLQKFDCQKT